MIVDDTPVVEGVVVPPVIATYFERAVAYDSSADDSPSCVARARAALAGGGRVASSCAPGALGIGSAPGACTEMPGAGEVDPDELRCGELANDLAIALSGLEGDRAQLTRLTQLAGDGQMGVNGSVRFTQDVAETPVLMVRTDISACPIKAVEQSGCDCGNSFSYCAVAALGSHSSPGKKAYSLSLFVMCAAWLRRHLRKQAKTSSP